MTTFGQYIEIKTKTKIKFMKMKKILFGSFRPLYHLICKLLWNEKCLKNFEICLYFFFQTEYYFQIKNLLWQRSATIEMFHRSPRAHKVATPDYLN